MECYILDEALRNTEIVEKYESLIWTERHSQIGDFEIVVDPKLAETALSTQGTMIAVDKSIRVGVVDTTETKIGDDGVRRLSIKGKTIEDILTQRPNQSPVAGAAPTQISIGPDEPADIMRTLFHEICRTNVNNTSDNIPFIQSGVWSPTSGLIAEPADLITVKSNLATLYDTIKQIGDIYNLGFRLIRPGNDSKLYFEVYTGYDRTSLQTDLPPVVFSENLDSLTNTSELTSISVYKNVAYVYATNGSRLVYAEGVDPSVAGFDKRLLLVEASDFNSLSGAPLQEALLQKGLEELAKNRVVIGFDGEIAQNGAYIYGVDYNLGDLVEQRSEKGTTTIMRVTEQIFIHDQEGEKSYPTLTLDTLIAAGTWDSFSPVQTWDDFTTETWDTL